MSSDRHNTRKSRPWRPLTRLMQALFRLLFHITGRRRSPQAGFVFPTTLLLLLMVTLTATALTVRTFSRSEQAITQRQQQVIYNAATPAIDRAKAKIEFMFQTDNRFPSGVPASDQLANLMLPPNAQIPNASVVDIAQLGLNPDTDDPYTLPGEERVDLDGDGNLDNAWKFESEDIDDDGDREVVIYSILVDHAGPRENSTVDITDPNAQTKADALVTRTGPLATTEATPLCQGARSEGGWQVVTAADNSSLQKNFQVNAIVAKDPGSGNPVFETLEFQQSRIAARANKWGAWFRYDLELHPGPGFNWNGAMHTDGNLLLAGGIEPFMVSSFNSCLYSQESSEITLGEFDNTGDTDSDGNPTGDGSVDLAYDPGALGDFQGQAIIARTAEDQYQNNTIDVHVFNGDGVAPNREDFNTGSDSVNNSGGRPSDVLMNPLILFTQGRESHLAPNFWNRDNDWEQENGGVFTQENRERIYNDETAKPFVDDFYRADDRWGPKPRYDSKNDRLDITKVATAETGSPITEADVIDTLTGEEEGLDGYWERQAIQKGMRIIVGQRLELGNANGWNYDPSGVGTDRNVNSTQVVADPLYPPNTLHADLNEIADDGDTTDLDNTNATNRVGRNSEYLHRKTLRDNLAAVQGMVVYHYQGPGNMATNGEFPAACVALTAHPGTQQSIIDSRTFNNYPSTSVLKADFLNGEGTNGWEFRYPTAFDTESEFATALGATQPLGKALRNWAYFAGDPLGGAPSFRPTQDDDIHPYPYLSMWGDVSPLRRIFEEYLDNSVAYADLSFADKATLHSAACTMSLLAYNVDTSIAEYTSVAGDDLTDVGVAFWSLLDPGNNGNSNADLSNYVGTNYDTFPNNHPLYPNEPIILTPNIPERDDWVDPNPGQTCPDPGVTDTNAFEVNCDEKDYYDQFTTEDIIRAYISENDQNATQLNDALADVTKIRSFVAGYQVLRDRALGFVRGPIPAELAQDPTDSVGWDEANLVTLPASNGQLVGKQYSSSCDPDIFTNIAGGGVGKGPKRLGLAVAFCSTKLDTKYPSLYYLFPLEEHGHAGAVGTYDHTQPTDEEYIADTYVTTENTGTSRYKVINGAVTTIAAEDVSAIAAIPGAADLSDWVLPAATSADGLTDPDAVAQAFRIQTPAGSGIDVSMLDKGIFNGRELMSVRLLDLDIEALTGTDAVSGQDKWLSSDLENQAEGIVYAFREDAVREDEIVRPKNSSNTVTPAFCRDVDRSEYPRMFAIERDNTCFMRPEPVSGSPQDPPLTDDLVSFKPVDFVPDPERRAHGFRFRGRSGNPVDFSNGGREVGMTFVTDNSIYTWGDFNVHSTDPTAGTNSLLEEFTDTILADGFNFNDFYGGRTRDELDLNNFADPDVDHWRPVELLSDSMTILSSNFVDGSIADGFIEDEASEVSSYTNQPRTEFANDQDLDDWIQENPGQPTTSPVWVDRNGTYYYKDGAGLAKPFYQRIDNDGDWRDLDERVGLQQAGVTYVNAVFVSGIVPTRARQPYGGLHNYVRFIEDWEDIDLYIQGSFIQLDFSTSGTGPFDQDAIEPGATPNNDEFINYYDPPDRFWGYDVGLLYVPPGPAAKRFVTIGSPRSEYYREIAADDPYIVKLRCAKDAQGNEIFPALCPN